MIEVDEFFERLSNYVRVHLYNRAQNTHIIHLICQNFNGIQSFIDPRVLLKKGMFVYQLFRILLGTSNKHSSEMQINVSTKRIIPCLHCGLNL